MIFLYTLTTVCFFVLLWMMFTWLTRIEAKTDRIKACTDAITHLLNHAGVKVQCNVTSGSAEDLAKEVASIANGERKE